MSNQRNINTQATDIPANIDGETPPSVPTLRAHGWRIEPPVPPVEDGYTRTSTRPDGAPGLFIEGDGETGAWEVVDVLTADIEAQAGQAAAARIAGLAEAYGGAIVGLSMALDVLDYEMPCDSRMVLADLIGREMRGELTQAQHNAKAPLAALYLMLQGAGITDADIAAVKAVLP